MREFLYFSCKEINNLDWILIKYDLVQIMYENFAIFMNYILYKAYFYSALMLKYFLSIILLI